MGIPFMIFEITKATHFIIHPYTIIQKHSILVQIFSKFWLKWHNTDTIFQKSNNLPFIYCPSLEQTLHLWTSTCHCPVNEKVVELKQIVHIRIMIDTETTNLEGNKEKVQEDELLSLTFKITS